MWANFWAWYDRQLSKNLLIMAIIIYLQLPHWLWTTDLLLETFIVAKQNLFVDFFLYGIDLIEIPLMIHVTMLIYSRFYNKKHAN